ncbi:MAG: hypothetical protein QT10_C0012G0009 [archaeon GW2011_AR19]|nr:MAG: hypothetical protein QT10_C0012G0009 [archaeon GW2011_AR19]
MKLNKTLGLTQILILLIGIFAFSFMIGEIGKSQGIEIARGVGIVSGQNANLSQGEGAYWAEINREEIPPITTQTTPGEDKEEKVTGKVETIDGKKYYVIRDSEGKIINKELLDEDDTKKNETGKDELSDKGKNKVNNWLLTTGGGIVASKVTELINTGEVKLFGKEILKLSGKTTEKVGEEVAKRALSKTFGGQLAISAAGSALGAAINWAIFKWIVGADVRNMRSASTASAIGFAAGTAAGVAVGTSTALGATVATGATIATGGTLLGIGTFGIGLIVALVVALFITLASFENYSKEVFNYLVEAWEPDVGGGDCDLCNELEFGCTEYQCRSFGKGCEIVNPGSVQEVCVWKDPDDIFPPKITALEKVLPSADYEYRPLSGVVTGVKIFYTKDSSSNGCILPYSSVTLGINTTKYADCKIDTERTSSYEEMIASMTSFEGFENEHILKLPHVAAPSVESQTASGIPITQITNGQNQEFFIRCESANGISNVDEYIMEFCVQDGPDAFPPVILGTNLEGKFLQYNQSEANLQIYTNEPAECKWSFEDLNYDAMQFEMNQCSQTEGDYMFPPFSYGCLGKLEGMKDRVENKVYIRCNDKPWWTSTDKGARYANEQSHVLKLQGTEPLVLDEITINGKQSGATIKDSVSTINVKLEAKAKFGADNGKSICQYEFGGNWIDFYNEGSSGFVNVNTQRIPLSEGFYNYSIRCFDAGLNSDEGNIKFTLVTDREAPVVARAYYDVNNLKVITDEPAQCVYTSQTNLGCTYNFADGTAMNEIGESIHYTSWQANKKYFIKCKDEFGNQPLPGQCSIIVRAFESFE